MESSQNEKQNAVLPFKTDKGFTGIPNVMGSLYTMHPKFTPTVERIYRYLLQRYNFGYGYAFPSWQAMQRECNVSRGSVSKALNALEYLQLITRVRFDNGSDWDNNGYYFVKPIEYEDEFRRVFGADLPEKYQKGDYFAGYRIGNDWF